MALLKLCRCGKPIDASLSVCQSCQDKQKDRHKLYDETRRDKQSSSLYNSKAWKVTASQARQRDNNLCQHCLKERRMRTADMVDHIIPVKVDWSLRLTLSNLQCLCNSCHKKKTEADKKIYGVGVSKKF